MNDGHQIPAVGLGTYQIRGGEGLDQILTAIQDGYRLLDTSTNYDSEGIVGEAIRRSGTSANLIRTQANCRYLVSIIHSNQWCFHQ
jgi:diketogulonate reductase-like aldo/keto reductase